MAHIQPFKALRPQPDLAQKVASKPYDVLNSEEAKEEAKGNALSFLHVTKSEIDLPSSIDIHSDQVYNKASENLQQFISDGTLFTEEKPCSCNSSFPMEHCLPKKSPAIIFTS